MSLPILPTFFGRATAASIQHVHLAALLKQLGETCQSLDREGRCPGVAPARLLDALDQEMRGHFQAEEADGYFGTLASELPELLPRIAELRADHTRMLEAVVELRLLTGDASRYSDLARGVVSLTERYKLHERIEADLVREFLLRD